MDDFYEFSKMSLFDLEKELTRLAVSGKPPEEREHINQVMHALSEEIQKREGCEYKKGGATGPAPSA
jgi:hypothetical protein